MSKVIYSKSAGIGVLELNRADKLNAIDNEMLDALEAALLDASGDDEIRVVILRGNGRAFSAGFDLDEGSSLSEPGGSDRMRDELQRFLDVIIQFWDFPKPIVASVHGYCLGSSMEITAVCDITIAAEGCRFGAPEVRFGSGIVCMILPWIIGLKNARELLLTGTDRIDAERAERIGLVNRVVPPDELEAETQRVADEIAQNDPFAVRLTKRAINRSVETAGLREALQEALEIDFEIETTETPESRTFNEIVNDQGLKAALHWRVAQFRQGRD